MGLDAMILIFWMLWFIHLIRTDSNVSFFWLSNIPLYMYHSFFIHSSVDGHLSCFYVLAIVNSAAVNIGVHVSFSIMVFLEYMLGMVFRGKERILVG